MSVQTRLTRLESAAASLAAPPAVDLSRVTPDDAAFLARLDPDLSRAPDADLSRARAVLRRATPPTPHGAHGTGQFPDCCCSHCEHYRAYHAPG